MGIEGKHAYRFVYLRSEKWMTLRSDALVKADAKCRICGAMSVFNDAHHIYYPKSFWDTGIDDLIILCRPCHQFIHDLESVGVMQFKQDKIKSMSGIVKLIEAVSKWKGMIPNPQLLDKVSIKAEMSRAVCRASCYACERAVSNVINRKFHFTDNYSEDLVFKFFDECFGRIEKYVPRKGVPINGKGTLHKFVRIIVKELSAQGRFNKV